MNQPNFKKVPQDSVKCKLKEQIKVVAKTDVSTEDVKNVISVSCWADAYSITSYEKRAEYKGKAIFFIAYKTQDGEIKKCEKTADFDGIIESEFITESSRLNLKAFSYKTETDLTGIKLCATGYVTLESTVYDKTEYECVESAEDIICDVSESTFYLSHGRKESVHPLTEEFTLSYKVLEVLSQNAVCVVTNAQCGVGSIIVDGEVYLSAILLQSNEKKDIIKENKVLPFRIEIECEDAMPAFRAVCSGVVRSFKTEVSVDDEKSVVSCVITLKLVGEAFSENTFSLTKDAFSKTENLEVKTDSFLSRTRLEDRCVRKELNLTISHEENLENCVPLGSFFERLEIVSKEKDGQKISLIGALSLNCIVKNAEDEVKTISLDFPLELNFECQGEDFDDFELFGVIDKCEVKIMGANEVSLSGTVVLSISPYKTQTINYVKEITACGEKKLEDWAISVVIPYKGEDLWSLSKRLNQSPEEITMANKDLTFPLTGEERIVIYRQK